MNFGVGKWQFISHPVIQSQTAIEFISVLRVSVQRISSNAPIEVASALQKYNWHPPKKTGESVGDGKSCENKEPVCGDALQGIHLQMLISATKLEFVCAANPAQCAGIIKGVFVSIARAGDRIANTRIAAYLNERWSRRGRKAG